jgi:TetR/AcrR family transcriptional repressor of nem operon
MKIMRYSPNHKRQTNQRIIRSAASLFRKRGYSATGVDAVMASANLTAGGFYSHFKSKEKLLEEALEAAFCDSRTGWPKRLKELQGSDWVRAFASFYLSAEHRDAPESGCPMPALTPEIARLSASSRAVFDRNLYILIDAVSKHLSPDAPSESEAIPAIALCVGALMLSRAIKDKSLSENILRACREALVRENAAKE